MQATNQRTTMNPAKCQQEAVNARLTALEQQVRELREINIKKRQDQQLARQDVLQMRQREIIQTADKDQ